MNQFYVYTLADPRGDQVFYVGKGQGERAWQHAKDVLRGRTGCNKAKEARIRSIIDAGLEPLVHIAHRFESEQDAFDTEADMIASLSGLTNIMAGGGRAMTPEAADRALEARLCRARERRQLDAQEYLRVFMQKVAAWPGVTFPGMKNGDSKAREFVSLVQAMLSKVDAGRPANG